MAKMSMMSFSLSKSNQNLLVGILGLLVLIWALMFVVPSLFIYLFHTLLGNLILLAVALFVASRNVALGLALGAAFIIMVRAFYMNK